MSIQNSLSETWTKDLFNNFESQYLDVENLILMSFPENVRRDIKDGMKSELVQKQVDAYMNGSWSRLFGLETLKTLSMKEKWLRSLSK